MSFYGLIFRSLTSCFRWDKPSGFAALVPLARPGAVGFAGRRVDSVASEQPAQPVGLMVGREETASLAHGQGPPRAVLWLDNVVFWGDQVTALQAPAGPSRAG
jgi:hypothetical protein